MKRLFAVLLIVLSVFAFMCNAEEIDVSALSFEELVELESQIKQRLMELYPDYDMILDDGEYFVGMDFDPGKVMFYQLNPEGTLINVADENDNWIDSNSLADWQPRLRYTLIKDYKLNVKRGPIGVKYLQD